LSFELAPEQVEALRPLMSATGAVKIAGTLEGNRLDVSFIACNAAFLACNAAFIRAEGEQQA
jgi:hypothetical protein